jgi:hypothetical protein
MTREPSRDDKPEINDVQTSLEPILGGYRDAAQDSSLHTADSEGHATQAVSSLREYAHDEANGKALRLKPGFGEVSSSIWFHW